MATVQYWCCRKRLFIEECFRKKNYIEFVFNIRLQVKFFVQNLIKIYIIYIYLYICCTLSIFGFATRCLLSKEPLCRLLVKAFSYRAMRWQLVVIDFESHEVKLILLLDNKWIWHVESLTKDWLAYFFWNSDTRKRLQCIFLLQITKKHIVI